MKSIRAVLAALLCLGAGDALAQANYPEQPIKIIVGFPAGVAPDVTSRLLGDKLTEAWGKPIVVENVTGASGNIAVERVAKAAPDGYTLLMGGNASLVINPNLFAKLPYSQHLGGELFKVMAGVQIQQVPYRGTPAVLPDLLAGRLNIFFGNITNLLPLIREGKLRAFGITSRKRSPQIPELPTMEELGFPGFDATAWFGLMAPTGTPAPIIDKLHKETVRLLALPDVKGKLESLGVQLVGSTPAEFAALIKTETPHWAKVIKDAGIKLND